MIFLDQINREIRLLKQPERIVSLVPSQTELLCYLGLKEKIVGITKFCVHPENLRKEKKVVGGTKSVHFDRIRNLKPDIILCNKEENTEEMVRELEKIAPVHISEVITFEDSLELIKMYGSLFGCKKSSEELVSEIRSKKEIFTGKLSGKKLKVAYLIWKDPWMGVGADTFINSMLELNGWINVQEQLPDRYPEISLDELNKLAADVIFLSSEPFPFREKHIGEIKPLNGCAALVDGEYFSWYGSRLLAAFDYFESLQKHLSKPL